MGDGWTQVGAFPNGVEYWEHAGEVYRLPRGYMVSLGQPMGARWECTLSHWRMFENREGTVPFNATHPAIA